MADNKRLDAVNRISSNASAMVLPLPASCSLSSLHDRPRRQRYTSRRMAACLRDMEIILRYVTYSVHR